MEMHIREEQSWVSQVLDHVPRDDQLEPPSKMHRLSVRSLHVETRGLHGSDPILVNVDTQDFPSLLDQQGMEGLIMGVGESMLRAGTPDVQHRLTAYPFQDDGKAVIDDRRRDIGQRLVPLIMRHQTSVSDPGAWKAFIGEITTSSERNDTNSLLVELNIWKKE